MKNQTLLSWSRITLIVIAVLLTSCNRNKNKVNQANQDQQKTKDVIYTEEQAKEVGFVTSGNIHFDEGIKVIFNNEVIGENEVGSSVEGVFTFSPNVKGAAIWESKNTLKFVPDEDFSCRTAYEGKVNLQNVSLKYKEKKIDDIVFRFNVLGRDISSFNGSLELKDRNDPKILIYSGSVIFSEKTKLEVVQRSVVIKGGKDISLTWSQVDDWNFLFTSTELNRTEKNQDFKVVISKKELELEYDYSETFVISPLKKMLAVDFKTDEDGRKPRIRVSFSDELDMEQDVVGLISIDPSVKFEVKKLGKILILDGKFKFGEKYTVNVQKGVRSRWGSKTESIVSKELQFSNIPPQVEFASNGIVLPSSNKKKVQFYTTNLKRVHLQVKKVFPGKIGQFASSEKLNSTKTRNQDFTNYESHIGVIIKNQTIELGDKKNEWLLNEFDLSDLFEKYDNGLFLIRINFTPEDVDMPIQGDVLNYIVKEGQIYKPVFLSDLGLTIKKTDGKTYAFVTDLITGKPRSSVRVSLLDYNGDLQTSGNTNSKGVTTFSSYSYFRYVMAQDGNDVTVLSKNEMKWSNSGFDIGGIRERGNNTKGFIYTERGVYRPGDSINIGFIVKNNGNTFPSNHPVNIRVIDPKYNTVYEKKSVISRDGFYVFGFKTENEAQTGNYKITINAGGSNFYKNLKIETVVAEQLKVLVKPRKKQFVWTDKVVDFDIKANYLFGAPASNLQAEATVEAHNWEIKFPKYSEFTFTRADVEFKSVTQSVIKKELDAEGKLSGKWYVPSLGNVPSALKLKIIAKVFEKSGTPNEGWNVIRKHVYPNYVGIKDPSGYGYYKTGKEVKFPIVLLNTKGEKVSGKQLQYRIYRNDKRWWYQYNDRGHYRLRYKEDNKTYLESKGSVNITEGSNFINFTPAENGEYYIEVSDGGNGHTASMFFSAYKYGRSTGGDQNEGTLALRCDKEKYTPYEKAKIKLPNPKKGNILVTVERGYEILNWFWVDPSTSDAEELIIDIPLNKEMLPNVFATVTVLQPHDQTVNDRPIRMFGIIPIYVEDPDSKLVYVINTKNNLSPNEDFIVNVSTQNQKQSQFTIAVVDEGLLSLTQFRTPQPWNEFFKKVGLFVESYDMFNHVISANKGDVFQTFSIGGSDDMDYRESQLDDFDSKKRFEPVCMFKGPVTTDNSGNAKVKFHMPNYNGAVRVMIVGTDKGSFGNGEKTVPVRSDIIMQPSIPRILKPGDEFELPVALFNMNSKIKTAQFTLTTDGPLEIVGDKTISVNFDQNSEADITYKVKVKAAVGQAYIKLVGTAGDIKVENETNVMVVPSATRAYDKKTVKIQKGKTTELLVPKVGIDGTNNATLELSFFPDMDFEHRLKWLIRYPYGCIEQTTSSVFPQLTLKKMGYFPTKEILEIDNNIDAGISRLQMFMVNRGGFSYWPGNTTVSNWGSNYATHFLIEAREMGYHVPDFMYDHAISGLRNLANRHKGQITTRVNRVFVLALANKESMSEMNLLMENSFDKMKSTDKWMLATAYHLAGAEDIRDKILLNAGTVTEDYPPFTYHYGSKSRDDAIILYCAVKMKKMDIADLLAKNIASVLSKEGYLSTQSAGYMILSLGKYLDAIGITASNGKDIIGSLELSNGDKIDFDEKGRFSTKIEGNFNKKIKCTLSESSTLETAYITLSWNGVPMIDNSDAVKKNIDLKVAWYDENGNNINPQNVKQGSTIFGRYTVKNLSPISNLLEIALVQILPSGWAIENTRLNNTLMPDWTRSWNTNKEEFLDIRDDRIMWFFDLKGNISLDFIVKINCINAGSYWLPPTLVEAMYNSDFKAKTKGEKVYVESYK